MNRIAILIWGMLFLSCKNNYKDVFFEPIFGLKGVNLKLECGVNNEIIDGQGKVIEKYFIPDRFLNLFLDKDFSSFPKQSIYSKKFDSIVKWNNAPIPNIYKKRFSKFSSNGCLGKSFPEKIDNPNNLYSIYYTVEGEFYVFFLLDVEDSSLYVVEETW